MKAKLPWKSAFNVCIWNALELLHLCYCLKQQIVHWSAILNNNLKRWFHISAAKRKGECKVHVANADSGLKIWP